MTESHVTFILKRNVLHSFLMALFCSAEDQTIVHARHAHPHLTCLKSWFGCWRVGSATNTAACYSRGPRFKPQHLCQVAHNYL